MSGHNYDLNQLRRLIMKAKSTTTALRPLRAISNTRCIMKVPSQ